MLELYDLPYSQEDHPNQGSLEHLCLPRIRKNITDQTYYTILEVTEAHNYHQSSSISLRVRLVKFYFNAHSVAKRESLVPNVGPHQARQMFSGGALQFKSDVLRLDPVTQANMSPHSYLNIRHGNTSGISTSSTRGNEYIYCWSVACEKSLHGCLLNPHGIPVDILGVIMHMDMLFSKSQCI